MSGFDCHVPIGRDDRDMTSYIERNDPLHLESAADDVLAELAESRDTGRLLAKAVMNSHHVFGADDEGNTQYQCIHCNVDSQDYEYQPGEIKHEEGCPVLTAMRVLEESTEP